MKIEWKSIRTYIVNRLYEGSTWRSFVYVLTACGAGIKPQYTEVIVSVGIGLAGFLGVAMPDVFKRTEQ